MSCHSSYAKLCLSSRDTTSNKLSVSGRFTIAYFLTFQSGTLTICVNAGKRPISRLKATNSLKKYSIIMKVKIFLPSTRNTPMWRKRYLQRCLPSSSTSKCTKSSKKRIIGPPYYPCTTSIGITFFNHQRKSSEPLCKRQSMLCVGRYKRKHRSNTPTCYTPSLYAMQSEYLKKCCQ